MARTIAQRLAALEKTVAGFLRGKPKKAKAKRSKRKPTRSRKASASRKTVRARKAGRARR